MRKAGCLVAAYLFAGSMMSLSAQVTSLNSGESRRAAVDIANLPDEPMPAAALPGSAATPQMRSRTEFEFLKKPLTPQGKFYWSMRETILAGVPGSAIAAGLAMATNSNLENGYEDGGEGYARRFLANISQTGVSHLMGDWAAASILHQDPRYHPSEQRGFGKRLGWAISRVFVTQKDSGAHTFNSSRLFGIAAGAAAANAWHHEVNRGGSETAQRFGWEVVSDLADNVVREFWEYRKYPRQ